MQSSRAVTYRRTRTKRNYASWQSAPTTTLQKQSVLVEERKPLFTMRYHHTYSSNKIAAVNCNKSTKRSGMSTAQCLSIFRVYLKNKCDGSL